MSEKVEIELKYKIGDRVKRTLPARFLRLGHGDTHALVTWDLQLSILREALTSLVWNNI